MKKIIISMVVMAMFAVMPASAQGIAFGVKGGVNFTKMSIDNDAVDCEAGVGFFVGPTLKIDFLPFLGVQGSIFYEQANSKVAGEKIKRQSVIVPIDVRVNLKLNEESGIYLATGPQFGFNVGDKEKKLNVGDWSLKTASISGNVGLGAMLINHLQVSINYNFALSKSAEIEVANQTYKVKNNAWQIALAYYF